VLEGAQFSRAIVSLAVKMFAAISKN